MTHLDEAAGRPTTTARCLWCGGERPVAVDLCPTCEHAWIDATIEEARSGRLDGLSAGPPTWTEPPRSLVRSRWLLVALVAAVAAIYGAILIVSSNGGDPPVAASTQAPSPTTAAPARTTVAPPTTPAPTTSTTTTSTSTTTSTTTTLPPIAVVEPPYATAELTLGAFALGPIGFGSSDPDAIGRLAATFGQPTAILPAGETWGLCPGETGRVLEFGYLAVILRDTADGEELVGYRQRLEDGELDPDDISGALRTISGLGLLDSLGDAERLYSGVVTAQLRIQQDETLPAGTPIYIVQRSSDRRTLIWGKLSGDVDRQILSINSPNSCDQGPTP